MPSRRHLANAIRFLSIDAVEKAASGHPGMPMGMADIAEVLWRDFLTHDPAHPRWHNRDRFIVSNGHGSMLLYALLHLSGYDLSIDDIKNFRQLHSKTPGHPECDITPGVEVTAGPLGQGLAAAVGMAVAESVLSAQFNRPDFTVIDHHTYVFAGDGCLMEGISHEACALAGTLGLGKLIVFWDDNGISIDGEIDDWMEQDPAGRFESYGWQVIRHVDGHDAEDIKQAIDTARAENDKPTLICCRTQIGYGSPNKAGGAGVHGSPLGAEEIKLTREQLQWPHPPFVIPDEIYQAWDATTAGQTRHQAWQKLYDDYRQQYPDLAPALQRRLDGELPADFAPTVQQMLTEAVRDNKAVATRKMTAAFLERLGPTLPELLGGSADLSGSNNTVWSGVRAYRRNRHDANYIHYGVREFAMAAMMNGIALHGGFIPYGGTFLVFASYSANALRMAALMQQRVIHVLTHDSIGLGEDGPTHQPVEQLAMLRAIPNFDVWRPCDAIESIVAWEAALQRRAGPSALCMTRQTVPAQQRDDKQIADIRRGGYILYDSDPNPEIILIATGSEVGIAMAAAQQSARKIRVVSMPCCEAFDRQDAAYRQSVLPDHIDKRIAIEAGAGAGWYQYLGRHGQTVALDRFGLSAPYKAVYEACGITVERVSKLLVAIGNK